MSRMEWAGRYWTHSLWMNRCPGSCAGAGFPRTVSVSRRIESVSRMFLSESPMHVSEDMMNNCCVAVKNKRRPCWSGCPKIRFECILMNSRHAAVKNKSCFWKRIRMNMTSRGSWNRHRNRRLREKRTLKMNGHRRHRKNRRHRRGLLLPRRHGPGRIQASRQEPLQRPRQRNIQQSVS